VNYKVYLVYWLTVTTVGDNCLFSIMLGELGLVAE